MSATNEKISESKSCSSPSPRDKKTYSVKEIANILEISKTKAYDLCINPEFRVIRLGRTIRISKQSFDDWLNNLL